MTALTQLALAQELQRLTTEAAAARRAGIEEAASYHDELAKFFREEGRRQQKEGFAGLAEQSVRRANTHRTYAEDIRARVVAVESCLAEVAAENVIASESVLDGVSQATGFGRLPSGAGLS